MTVRDIRRLFKRFRRIDREQHGFITFAAGTAMHTDAFQSTFTEPQPASFDGDTTDVTTF